MSWTVIRLIDTIFDIFIALIFIEVIGSWILLPRTKLPAFVTDALHVVHNITGYVLDPIRRVIPSIGGLDFSPIVALLLIDVLRNLLIRVLQG